MKKIIFVLIVLFITISEVEALEINATKYIDNAYVKKEIDGLTYYHQVQFSQLCLYHFHFLEVCLLISLSINLFLKKHFLQPH